MVEPDFVSRRSWVRFPPLLFVLQNFLPITVLVVVQEYLGWQGLVACVAYALAGAFGTGLRQGAEEML